MEDLYISEEDRNDLETERYGLAIGRIKEMAHETVCDQKLQAYFHCMAEFVLQMDRVWCLVQSGDLRRMELEELQTLNRKLYEDILPEHYDQSYANPDFAVACLGKPMGQTLSFVYTELRGMIPAAFERNRFGMVIRMELLLEIYQAFVCDEASLEAEELQRILYWYVSDYFEPETAERIAKLVSPKEDFASCIVMESDLSDLRYLYYYGEYVTDNELRTARHLNRMTQEKISLLADTYTEGYRIGFEVGNKDISRKKTVNIRYCLGFERVIRQAVCNFERIGLRDRKSVV